MTEERMVFYVSDGSGVTAETFGQSLLVQFDGVRFKEIRLPFVSDTEKALETQNTIDQAFIHTNQKPLVFSTLVNEELLSIIKKARAQFFDLFQAFVEPLEQELGVKSNHTMGKSHHAKNQAVYQKRIEAINFSLEHDDGQSARNLEAADVILVGVSRSAKTPTSLYLAMQYGVKVANYPFIPEDFERGHMPETLRPYRHKLFGLSIDPERLSEIRFERRPNSTYASLANCQAEVAAAERMMRQNGIRWVNSTSKSIEEISATILQALNIGN
jgi:regulator of PEP synthase PpsR (kinase-PPPase family)